MEVSGSKAARLSGYGGFGTVAPNAEQSRSPVHDNGGAGCEAEVTERRRRVRDAAEDRYVVLGQASHRSVHYRRGRFHLRTCMFTSGCAWISALRRPGRPGSAQVKILAVYVAAGHTRVTKAVLEASDHACRAAQEN